MKVRGVNGNVVELEDAVAASLIASGEATALEDGEDTGKPARRSRAAQ